MQEMLRRMRHRGDAGLSLLEVVIAMFVFAIVSIAVVHSLTSVLTVTRDSRNREIASMLFLSERTAQNHVQHILNKLDLPNRSQIALWVREQKLSRSTE